MSFAATVGVQRALLAAAFALVSERCRNAYMHDIKGGLQSLHSAVELTSRSAAAPTANPAMTEKVAALAKRALATHESELRAFSLQVAPSDEPKATLDLSQLVTRLMHFLGNDALARSLTIETQIAGEVSAWVEAYQCRLLILGLAVTSIDAMPAGSIFKTAVYTDGDLACVELPTVANAAPQRICLEWPARATASASLTAHEFLLGVTAVWAGERGGSVVIKEGATEQSESKRMVLLRLPRSADRERRPPGP